MPGCSRVEICQVQRVWRATPAQRCALLVARALALRVRSCHRFAVAMTLRVHSFRPALAGAPNVQTDQCSIPKDEFERGVRPSALRFSRARPSARGCATHSVARSEARKRRASERACVGCDCELAGR